MVAAGDRSSEGSSAEVDVSLLVAAILKAFWYAGRLTELTSRQRRDQQSTLNRRPSFDAERRVLPIACVAVRSLVQSTRLSAQILGGSRGGRRLALM